MPVQPDLTATAINLEHLNPQLLVKDFPAAVAQALTQKAVEELGVRITQPIFKLLRESTIGVVLNAIAAVKQRIESPTAEPVYSREALFTTALRRHFTPNRKPQETPVQDQEKKITSKEFSDWYNAAYAAGLVCASTMINGEMWLYQNSGDSVARWEELKAKYPDLLATKGEQKHYSAQGQQRALEKPKLLQGLKPGAESPERPKPVDLSDVIVQTSIEMKRLGWQETELRSHLSQTYGKRSRQQLKDEELIDFLDWLQQQTAMLGDAFSVWTGGQPWGKPAT